MRMERRPDSGSAGRSDGKEKIVVLLPGPPHELKALFEGAVLERLRAKVPKQFISARVLKITGLGESACDARVAPIYKRFADVDTTILAAPGEIQLHLRTRGESEEVADKRWMNWLNWSKKNLGDNVYSDNGDSLEQIVSYFLQMRDATLAVAESCTGGLVAERLTSVSGSSRYFIGGAVVYSNELKDPTGGCAGGFDRRLRRSQRAGGTGARRRHPQEMRNDFGTGCYWSSWPNRWNGGKARGTGVSRAGRRTWNGSGEEELSG